MVEWEERELGVGDLCPAQICVLPNQAQKWQCGPILSGLVSLTARYCRGRKKIHAITIKCDQAGRERAISLGWKRLLGLSWILRPICDIQASTELDSRPISVPVRPKALTNGAHDPTRFRDLHDPRVEFAMIPMCYCYDKISYQPIRQLSTVRADSS